ncbi:MAG: response regulator [Spirochaetales bacterium]|nr:response regulator [Spirochaetales bacterium]
MNDTLTGKREHSIKILIVDDSEATRASLKFSLSMKKFNVTGAADVDEAINILNRDRGIKLVITDMNMPGMSGLDLLSFIRGKPEMKTLPVIVLTTAEDKGREALARGASAFIMKSSKASEEIYSFITRYLLP